MNQAPPGDESISVVVPCLNEAGYIGQLLAAIGAQDHGPAEIVIVDGGSTDGTLAVVRDQQASLPAIRVTVIERAGASISSALNAGIATATGSVIARLDAHSTPAPHYLRQAVETLQLPEAGVVGGVWTVRPGAATVSARAIATAVAHPLGAGNACYRIGRTTEHPTDVDTVPYGCFRKSLWEALGGYDERLLANEDYEFNYRVRQHGQRVVLDPRLTLDYFARPTLAALARQYFRYGWWKARMLRMHPASLRWRQAIPTLFVGTVLALTLASAVWPALAPVLALTLAAYALVIVATSGWICWHQRGMGRVSALVAAFATVHVSWGLGAILGLIAGGRVLSPHNPPRDPNAV